MEKNNSFFQKLDFLLFGWIINWAYPQYYRQRYGYMKYGRLLLRYFIPQKILRINGSVPWPVHFTSRVECCENIQKGILCDPGDNIGIYIQARNGLILGNNVGIGQGVRIISANHTHGKLRSSHDPAPPIKVGDNVMIYANSVVLPGVEIGDNVIIGAGSVVTKNIPSNSIAVGNPCRVIKQNVPYVEDFSGMIFNKRVPEKFKGYVNSFQSTGAQE